MQWSPVLPMGMALEGGEGRELVAEGGGGRVGKVSGKGHLDDGRVQSIVFTSYLIGTLLLCAEPIRWRRPFGDGAFLINTVPFYLDCTLYSFQSHSSILLMQLIFTFVFVFTAKFPLIDIAFALSSTGISSNETYKLMKDTIELIIEKYGTSSMRYSFIPYSDYANINIKFSEKYPSLEDLQAAIKALLPHTGGSNLPAALAAAKEAFEDSGVRKHATHVLVVLTDNRSGSSIDGIKKTAKPLQDSGIVVIPVGIGNQVNIQELEEQQMIKKMLFLSLFGKTPKI